MKSILVLFLASTVAPAAVSHSAPHQASKYQYKQLQPWLLPSPEAAKCHKGSTDITEKRCGTARFCEFFDVEVIDQNGDFHQAQGRYKSQEECLQAHEPNPEEDSVKN